MRQKTVIRIGIDALPHILSGPPENLVIEGIAGGGVDKGDPEQESQHQQGGNTPQQDRPNR